MSREAALGARLAAKGWPFAGAVEAHESLGSTNDRLKDLARGGAPEGTIVVANAQTGGRGRQGRVWVSPPGNLYLSVLLRPRAEVAPLLTLAVGVAVAEALAAWGVDARLKWPNDVMLEEKKLGGILVEASSTGTALDWAAVGIGINVGAALPADLQDFAISLAAARARVDDIDDVAAAILARVAVWYHRLQEHGSEPVLSAWREQALPWWGRRVEARCAEGSVEGVAIDIDETGGLVLVTADGSRRVLRSGEVARARTAPDPPPCS